MDTETMDRLFLELSQFTRANTGKELKLHALVDQLVEALETLVDAAEGARVFINSREMIKQPEGAELYDEAIGNARRALGAAAGRPS